MLVAQASYGPIATKLLKARRSKIERKMKRCFEDAEKASDFPDLMPLHALYVSAHNTVSDFISEFSDLPEMEGLNKMRLKADDIYMPSGPPMSPISESCFSCWSAFDMSVGTGVKRETYGTIFLDFCRAFEVGEDFIEALACLQQSRMGLYVHEGREKGGVLFREIWTNKTFKVSVASEHLGYSGEIWLVRILPNLLDEKGVDLAFSSPYVILDAQEILRQARVQTHTKAQVKVYSEQVWLDFIQRNLAKHKKEDQSAAYEDFMKYGPDKHYWLEYIFLAYLNYTETTILLTGEPDRAATLPHSPENSFY